MPLARGRHARSSVRPALGRLAAVVAAAAGSGLAAPSSGAWAATVSPAVGATAVAYAAQEAGDPYVYGAAGPSSFDCSGLVQYVYGRLGIPLPRTAAAQYGAMAHVSNAEVRPGDVVFFYDAGGGIYHDGIYAGAGQMWAAPHTGDVVREQAVYGTAWEVGRPSTGTPVTAPAPAVALLQVGSRGPAVTEVQRALGVAADGVFGSQTAAAVTRFQAAHGLVPDGIVGTQTKEALLAAAPASAPVLQPVSTSSRGTALLRYGDSGPAVATLQSALHVGADGQFGPITRAAVLDLQRRSGLVADGVVGPLTWAALGGA